MNTYTFINTNKEFTIRVHKQGCQNIGLEIQRGHGNYWNVEADSVGEAIDIQKQEFQEQGMGEFYYELEPCTEKKKIKP